MQPATGHRTIQYQLLCVLCIITLPCLVLEFFNCWSASPSPQPPPPSDFIVLVLHSYSYEHCARKLRQSCGIWFVVKFSELLVTARTVNCTGNLPAPRPPLSSSSFFFGGGRGEQLPGLTVSSLGNTHTELKKRCFVDGTCKRSCTFWKQIFSATQWLPV